MSIERFVRRLDGPCGYSRALSLDLCEAMASLPGSQELPFVRGRTVIPAGFDRNVIVGFPNHLGVFDNQDLPNAVYLTGRWSGLRTLPGDARTFSLEPTVDRQVANVALEAARLLSKRLRQLRGVQIAFKPQSPILVVLAPRAGRGFGGKPGMTLLGDRYPELPGGIRLEMPQDARRDELNRYAADVVEHIGQEA